MVNAELLALRNEATRRASAVVPQAGGALSLWGIREDEDAREQTAQMSYD